MNKFDVIVVGGGIAGSAAAVSAAREGQKVLLIENGFKKIISDAVDASYKRAKELGK